MEASMMHIHINELRLTEHRKLRALERDITAVDPVLADRFTMFAVRYRGYPMPHMEELNTRRSRRAARTERWLALWMGI